MIVRLTLSFLLKLIDLSLMAIGLVVVPLGIKFGFKGLLWLWGNGDHPDNGGEFWRNKCGDSFWCAYQWFALRNPTFNFSKYVIGVTHTGAYSHVGDAYIGDKKKGGSYWCYMGKLWEYYRIVPYGKRCIRIRFGWKIYGKKKGDMCQFCFVFNPVMPYSGV